jgi:hypothetical protein
MVDGLDTKRKRQFMAALALAGITKLEWRIAQGVSDHHLNEVLSGERTGGQELNAAIDALIETYRGEMVA